MVLQGELADGEEELLVPMSVVVGDEVKDDRDEKADVVDGDGLRVQVQVQVQVQLGSLIVHMA
jgi:hypothetical protein